MKNKIQAFALCVTLGCAYNPAQAQAPANKLADITRYTGGTVSAAFRNDGDEGIDKLTDNAVYTKYLSWQTTTWVQYAFEGGATVEQYALTSANDEPARDPKDWSLQGSNDAQTWQVLDTRKGEAFTRRHETRTYTISKPGAFKYYRLNIEANGGARAMQLAEWQLFGTAKGKVNTTLEAPRSFTATAVSPYQVNLAWQDASTNETAYTLEWSTDNKTWRQHKTLPANDNFFYCRYLKPNTLYHFRLRANGKRTATPHVQTQATTPPGELPATWQEHWFDHDFTLKKRYADDSLALYVDDAVDTDIQWVINDFRKVWRYTLKTYGGLGSPYLFIILHSTNRPGLSGGHPAATFNQEHDWRNVIDMAAPGWSNRSEWNLGATVHEIAHIIEGASKDVDRSPSFGIWGDSKWAEIFCYDVYHNLGWNQEAQKLYDDMMRNHDDFPRKNTYWFRDWFYPIYATGGGSAALNRYFELLSKHFPQHNSGYAHDLNMGEFIHFWSGAVGYDLSKQAEIAFGPNEQYQKELAQARIDYPLSYSKKP